MVHKKCGCSDDKIQYDQKQNEIEATGIQHVDIIKQSGKYRNDNTYRKDRKRHVQEESADERELWLMKNQIASRNSKSDEKAHCGRGKVDVDNIKGSIHDNADEKPDQGEKSAAGIQYFFENKRYGFHNTPERKERFSYIIHKFFWHFKPHCSFFRKPHKNSFHTKIILASLLTFSYFNV